MCVIFSLVFRMTFGGDQFEPEQNVKQDDRVGYRIYLWYRYKRGDASDLSVVWINSWEIRPMILIQQNSISNSVVSTLCDIIIHIRVMTLCVFVWTFQTNLICGWVLCHGLYIWKRVLLQDFGKRHHIRFLFFFDVLREKKIQLCIKTRSVDIFFSETIRIDLQYSANSPPSLLKLS